MTLAVIRNVPISISYTTETSTRTTVYNFNTTIVDKLNKRGAKKDTLYILSKSLEDTDIDVGEVYIYMNKTFLPLSYIAKDDVFKSYIKEAIKGSVG